MRTDMSFSLDKPSLRITNPVVVPLTINVKSTIPHVKNMTWSRMCLSIFLLNLTMRARQRPTAPRKPEYESKMTCRKSIEYPVSLIKGQQRISPIKRIICSRTYKPMSYAIQIGLISVKVPPRTNPVIKKIKVSATKPMKCQMEWIASSDSVEMRVRPRLVM